MKAKNNSTYTLHFTTSSLFITLIIVFGGILSWQNYKKTSEILIESGDQVFDQINTEITLELGSIRKSVMQTVSFIAHSSVGQTNSVLAPTQSLNLFSIALANDSNLSAIQIGYPNGDFFIIRPIYSEHTRQTFKAPDAANYIVDTINIDEQGKRSLLRLFYNARLQEISRNTAIQTAYDPRERPWYKQALESKQATTTSPYLFHFSHKVGLTLTTQAPYQGLVVAADVTLEQLSNTLQHRSTTPGSEIVVFQKNADVLIYTDNSRLIIKASDGSFKMAKLSELGSDVLDFLSIDLQLESKSLNFKFNEQSWLGAIREMHIPGGHSFFVLMVSPEKELLSSAIKIRDQSLLMTAIIILLTIPIVWLFARKVSSPLRRLANEAELISNFDFSSPVKTHSMIAEVDALSTAMNMMKSTISQFLSLIHSLAGEQNLDTLLQRITQQTMQISEADGAVTYLYKEKENILEPSFMHIGDEDIKSLKEINRRAMLPHEIPGLLSP